MSRLFIVLNDLSDFDFGPLLKKHLGGHEVDIGVSPPCRPSDYRLVLLWSYHRIIKEIPQPNNIILFHSSDLPKGRGWAPIYNAIAQAESEFVVSGIFAAKDVDAGDIIVKARFPIEPFHMGSDLRRFDSELSIMLTAMILKRFEGRQICGSPQRGSPTTYPRRKPEDNMIDPDEKLSDVYQRLRACEPNAPAFFVKDGVRFELSLKTTTPAPLPTNIQIRFGEDGE